MPARVNHHDTQALISICLSLLVILPILVSLWVAYRALLPTSTKLSNKDERLVSPIEAVSLLTLSHRTPLPTSPIESKVTDITITASSAPHDMTRLGMPTIYIFCATSTVILGVCGFLSFLWFGNETNATWKSIMVHNWATRSASVSALLLRTAVDFQAAIVSAMLVALLLESSSGVHPYHLAHFSPMRSGNSGPWSLAHHIWLELWRSAVAYKRYGKWTLVTLVLLSTTVILQFSSTILLSDLKPGPLGGYDR
jgi:hypothetical protein